MRAVGMILCAVRHCYPEGKYGVSQLCKMMSCPSNAAFDAAIHMIAYVNRHKNKGILFIANGNIYPVIMSDASNKPDPHSGLAHAGHTALGKWSNISQEQSTEARRAQLRTQRVHGTDSSAAICGVAAAIT